MSILSNFPSNISGIEVGIDIATSITILVSLIALVLETRRQAKREREKGIDQNARNVAASEMAKSISNLSDIFVNGVVENAQKYENKVDIFFREGGEEHLLRHIKENRGYFSDREKDLQDFRSSIGKFFENLHCLKYQIIPVLDTLEDGEKFIKALKKEVNDVAQQFNKFGSGYLALIREYESLSASIDESEGEMNDEILKAIYSIITDLDYWEWTKTFTRSENRDICKSLLERGDFNNENIKSMMANLLGLTKDRKEQLMIQIYGLASAQVQEARIECKDVLCNISAIYHMLISKDLTSDLNSIIEKYKSDEYFALTSEIR